MYISWVSSLFHWIGWRWEKGDWGGGKEGKEREEGGEGEDEGEGGEGRGGAQ